MKNKKIERFNSNDIVDSYHYVRESSNLTNIILFITVVITIVDTKRKTKFFIKKNILPDKFMIPINDDFPLFMSFSASFTQKALAFLTRISNFCSKIRRGRPRKILKAAIDVNEPSGCDKLFETSIVEAVTSTDAKVELHTIAAPICSEGNQINCKTIPTAIP